MTTKQKALFTLFYFLVMLIVTLICRKNIWKAICKASGRTMEEINNKKNELYSSPKVSGRALQTDFEIWISANAPNRNKLKQLMMFYRITLVPSIFCFIFSLMGLTTHSFDKILFAGYFIVPIFAVIAFVLGVANKKS